jgi:hypothetical protein
MLSDLDPTRSLTLALTDTYIFVLTEKIIATSVRSPELHPLEAAPEKMINTARVPSLLQYQANFVKTCKN